MDSQGISDRLYEALSNDDLWSHPEIVDDVEKLADAYDELKAENAKLRELVRNWYELAVGGADSLTDWNHEQADLENRMRELGFEVDG